MKKERKASMHTPPFCEVSAMLWKSCKAFSFSRMRVHYSPLEVSGFYDDVVWPLSLRGPATDSVSAVLLACGLVLFVGRGQRGEVDVVEGRRHLEGELRGVAARVRVLVTLLRQLQLRQHINRDLKQQRKREGHKERVSLVWFPSLAFSRHFPPVSERL